MNRDAIYCGKYSDLFQWSQAASFRCADNVVTPDANVPAANFTLPGIYPGIGREKQNSPTSAELYRIGYKSELVVTKSTRRDLPQYAR